MSYIHRNSEGNIIRVTRWPDGSEEFLSDDNSEVVLFFKSITTDTIEWDGATFVECPNQHYIWDGAEWVYSSEKHREIRCDEVDALRGEKHYLPFSYEAKNWDIRPQDLISINGRSTFAKHHLDDVLANSLEEDQNPNLAWTGNRAKWWDYDNVDLDFTPEQFVLFSAVVHNHVTDLFQIAKDHKIALRLLTTEAEINGYDITTGW